MKNRGYIIIFMLLTVLICTGCNNGGIAKKELETIKRVVPDVSKKNIKQIKLTDTINDKFPAVKRAFELKDQDSCDYVFMATPVGYRGPISIAVLVDGEQREITNVSVIQHDETLIYAESISEDWFLERFTGKSVKEYLKRVVLEAKKPNEIIQITASTISTQAIINGVNSVMGAYNELVLNEISEPIPLKVEEFVTGVD